MTGSKATHCTTIREVAAATQTTINQPFSSPPYGILNKGAAISLHSDLVQAPQVAEFVQLPLIGHSIPPPVAQPKALPGFHLLRANLGLRGANEFLNNMYNIIP